MRERRDRQRVNNRYSRSCCERPQHESTESNGHPRGCSWETEFDASTKAFVVAIVGGRIEDQKVALLL